MKRFISLFLSACMLVSSPITLSAAENESTVLEQTIISAKKILNIPKEYSDFEYTTEDYSNKSTYYFTWSEKNSKDSDNSIHASIDHDGNVYSYSIYKSSLYSDDNNTMLNSYSKDECKAAAEEFLKKILPNNYSEFRLLKDSSINNGSFYNFTFCQYKNDIPVDFSTIRINVSKISKEVTNYNYPNADLVNASFPDTQNIIDKKAAKISYNDKLKLKPIYSMYYDYKTKKANVFLTYNPFDNNKKAIDAKTGSVVNYSLSDYALERDSGGSAKTMFNSEDEAADEELSYMEQQEVEKASGIISKEEALNTIANLLPSGTEMGESKTIRLLKDYINTENYIWKVYYKNGSAEINAKTKELISFYTYDEISVDKISSAFDIDKPNSDENKNTESFEKAKVTAEQFIQKIAKEKFEATKYVEHEENNLNNNHFSYTRKVNDIDFPENSINVRVGNNNNIISYNCTWYDNITFPSPQNIMTSEKALDKAEEYAGFGLKYVLQSSNENSGKKTVSLVYTFLEDEKLNLMDAETGKRINYDGSEYTESEIPAQYDDIKGHWCEETVNKLLNNGYYINRKSFLPDNTITQIEFFRYLFSNNQYYLTDKNGDDLIYKELISEKILSNNEKNPDKELTREDAVLYAAKLLGYNDIASVSEIYVNPFKDEISPKILGYAAICNALKIITPDKDGNFNQTDKITNADAASIIYGILKYKK